MARSKKMRAVLLALALSVGLLCACSAVSTPVTTQKHRVALVVKSTETEFWKSAFAGAKAAATEYNLELSIRGPETEEDYKTQNEMIGQAVEDGAEALVFSAIDYENNVPAIEAAAQAGLKLVAIDSGVASDKISTYIGTDNYAAGKMAASAALQSGESQICVGLVNYDANSANGQEREKGVREILEQLDNVEIVQAMNVFSIAENARIRTEAMLKQHPEINVIIAFNEPTSVGAARAVRDLGLEEDVWLVGFDSNVETVDLLQSGVVDILIVQNPYAMGDLGVESAYKLLAGQTDEVESTVDTATVLVTRENMFTPDCQKALFSFAGW